MTQTDLELRDGRTLHVYDIADALGIGRFAAMGHSGGSISSAEAALEWLWEHT